MKTFSALVLLIVIVAVGLIVGLLIDSHFETESRINGALNRRFPHKNITVNDRTDWEYTNQICFDVTVQSDAQGSTVRKIIMVRGDSDGGVWTTSPGEYQSMKQCENDFFRG